MIFVASYLFSLVVKMFVRNGFSLTFVVVSVFVLLLAVMTPATRAECDCDKPENEQKERHGFGKFVHNTLCGAKGVVHAATNKVKDGYNYVKNKLSPSDTDSTLRDIKPEETTYDVDLRFGDAGNTENPVNLAN